MSKSKNKVPAMLNSGEMVINAGMKNKVWEEAKKISYEINNEKHTIRPITTSYYYSFPYLGTIIFLIVFFVLIMLLYNA